MLRKRRMDARLKPGHDEPLEFSMPRTIIAITDSPFPSLEPAKQKLARLDPEYRMAKGPSADDILAVARDADAILVTYAKLPGELLRQLTRCKAIGRFGLGVDNIDLPAAKALGIAVNYVPDYCLKYRTTPWRFSSRSRAK
jgi:D-3-phosphoglycerate dehydrogenase